MMGVGCFADKNRIGSLYPKKGGVWSVLIVCVKPALCCCVLGAQEEISQRFVPSNITSIYDSRQTDLYMGGFCPPA